MKKYIFYSLVVFLAVAQYKTIVSAAKKVATSMPKAASKVEIKEKPKEKPEEKPEEKLPASPKLIDWPAVETKVGPHLKGIPGLPQMVVEYAKFTPEEIKNATEQLFAAINKSEIEGVLNAIRDGADVNAQDENSRRPLGVAMKTIQPEIVEILLNNGANPDQMGYRYSRSIKWILTLFSKEFLKTSKNKRFVQKNFNKLIQIMDLLLNYGASIQKGDLIFVAKASSTNMSTLLAKMLLDKGSNVNEKDETGLTPIIVAAHLNDAELVNLLLQSGADPNVDFFGDYRPPLISAAIHSNLEMGKSLIEHGADVNFTHVIRADVRHKAAPLTSSLYNYFPGNKQSEDFIQLLLEKGADVNFKSGPEKYSFLQLINIDPKLKRLKEIYEKVQKKKAETKTAAPVSASKRSTTAPVAPTPKTVTSAGKAATPVQ